MIKRLHALVKDRKQPNRLREQSMRALGKMGQCAAARSAMRVYFKSGGLKPLLFASIGALQHCKALKPFISQMVDNGNDQVVLLGLRAAFAESEQAGCAQLKRIDGRFRARRRSQIQDLTNRCLPIRSGANEPPKTE